jgi:hypothetical protein
MVTDWILQTELSRILSILAQKCPLERVVGLSVAETSILARGTNKKPTPWPLIRRRTMPTERQPFVDEI